MEFLEAANKTCWDFVKALSEVVWTFVKGNPAASVATVSLIVSIYALYKSNRTNARMLDIEEGRDKNSERERNSAVLKGYIASIDTGTANLGVVSPTTKKYVLRIENAGRSGAREIAASVKILKGVKDVNEEPLRRIITEKVKNGAWTLGPGACKDFPYKKYIGQARLSEIKIKWKDDTGDSNVFETTL